MVFFVAKPPELLPENLHPWDCRNVNSHLVEFLVKLGELRDLLHDLLAHEERRVQGREPRRVEPTQGQVDQCLLQEHGWTLAQKNNNVIL